MYDLAGDNELELEALRARLQRMSDRELLRFGRAARYLCSPATNHGKNRVGRSKSSWGKLIIEKECRRRHPGNSPMA
jgi:hypothetical protein